MEKNYEEKLKGNTIPQDLIKVLSDFVNIRIAKNNIEKIKEIQLKETTLKEILSLLCDLISSVHIIEKKQEGKSYYLAEYDSKMIQILRQKIQLL